MTQPEEPRPSDIPRPPGWGQGQQPQPPYQPAQPQPPHQPPFPQQPQFPQTQPDYPVHPPVYGPPQDPFQSTTLTPPTAMIPPYMGAPPQQPPKRRNTALIIVAIALPLVLLLCAAGGVGAYFLLRNNDGTGAPTAKDAAQNFLTAVYKDGNVDNAEKLVCSEARDRGTIEEKINQVKDQKSKVQGPNVTWETPKIENETDEGAETTVTVRLTTSDEKLSEQKLKLSLVKRDGWFVCEVAQQ